MPKQFARSANRPLLVTRINLWWYAPALLMLLGLGWLAASNLINSLFLPLVLFGFIFWLLSLVIAVIAKFRAPRPESRP